MYKWKKLGRIFNPTQIQDRDFIKQFAQAPSVLVYEKFVRVYFSTRPNPDETGNYVSYSTFLDLDRSDLKRIINISEKPILQLGKKGTFDEYGTYPVSVLNFQNRYICFYAGWTRCESVPFNVAIGFGESFDGGSTFNKIGDGPILSYSLNEPFILSGPKVRIFNNKWYLFYIAGDKWILDNDKPEPVYTIRLAVSNDGMKWEKLNKKLIEPKLEENEAQASPDVFYKDGKYHMYFCYRNSKKFREKSGSYRIGYAYSNDLINWTRDDENVGIDISKDGWDDESISYPHVFELDGKIYMMYLGNQVGKYGFGLAVAEN